MLKNLKLKLMLAGIAAMVALTASIASAQQPNIELTKPGLPKVPEPKIISVSYAPESGIGRVLAADRNGKVQQYLEIWEGEKKQPNVVTYVLVGDGQTFSATWGKGPVNRKAFNCEAGEIPEFSEKSFWVATVADGKLTFQEIKDGDVKGLFENLTQARRDWEREVSAVNQRRNTNLTQENILIFIKEKNREKWLQQGWLQLATTCIRHLS